MTVTTPTVGAALRRARTWLVLGALALVGALAVVLLSGTDVTGGRPLGPQNPAPAGAKALVEVLRQQGVAVQVTTDLRGTVSAASRDAAGTAVVVDDADGLLVADQWRQVAEATDHVLLLAPGQAALDAVAPGVALVGQRDDGTAAPGCDLPALSRVDEVSAGGRTYSADGDGVTACLRDPESDGSGLVEVDDGQRRVTVVGATSALTNGSALDADDAAYSLGLLGQSDRLVWYLPSADDVPEGAGTLATLTPGWVTPVLLLLALTAVAAGAWRGRRLGPLVVERLPVVVKASETTEGRARLYERSSSRRHALDQLRIGTFGRLGRTVGLPASASVDEVVERVAQLLSADRRGLRHVLLDAAPADDAELVRLSDSLLDLERAVSRAAAPS